jgi:uncharacterized protein YceH (UPF0502 family)
MLPRTAAPAVPHPLRSSLVQPPLTDVEVRVLGSLAEKEATTPDTYPLSASALVAACNQSSNRDPVMRLEEDTVMEAIVALRRRGLVRAIQPAGARVMKFAHLLREILELDAKELAVLGVLMLRGAQTPGELRARTERLAEFSDLGEVEATLEGLMRRTVPFVARLPRRAGQKEVRYAHLLAGEPVAESHDTDAPEATSSRALSREDRVAALEREVEALRAELDALRAELSAFRAQFQ